jgi:hypothetical protein
MRLGLTLPYPNASSCLHLSTGLCINQRDTISLLSLESNFNSLQMLFQAMLVKNYHTNTPIQNQAYFTYWSNWDIAHLFAMKIQERHLLSDLLSAHLLDCSILGAILISGEVQVDMANQAAGLHSFNFLSDCLSPICDTH